MSILSNLKIRELIESVSQRWKFIIKENYEHATDFIIHDPTLLKSCNFT